MEFFNGSIEEAVTLSKSKNAIFVVYVEDVQPEGAKLTKFINEQKIRIKLQSDDFVVIKVTSGTQAYMQFAAIYQVVPVPSMFFIGKCGKPLEIATEIIKNADELEQKISSALSLAGKSSPSASATSSTTSFIAHEQAAGAANAAVTTPNADVGANTTAAADATTPATPDIATPATADVIITTTADVTTPATAAVTTPTVVAESGATANSSEEAVVPDNADDGMESQVEASATVLDNMVECVGDICMRSSDIAEAEAAETSSQIEQVETIVDETQARSDEMRNLLEQKRRERVEEENRLEKERELQRRRDGKKMQNLRDWQKEQELKELRQNLIRERQAEKEERERIRAQIAGDRAERAQRNATAAVQDTKTAEDAEQKQRQFNINNPYSTHLLFRLPSGEQQTHLFESSQQLKDVRLFVKNELLSGSGIRDFYLAPSYPRLAFSNDDDTRTLLELGLVPNAVILVIGKESKISPTGIVARSGGILNLLSSLIAFLFSPFISAFGFLRRFSLKRTVEPDADAGNAADAAAKRRHIDNMSMGPSTSRAAAMGDLPHSTSQSNPGSSGNKSGTGSGSPNDTDGKPYRRYGGSNIHRLTDSNRDSDDENATWNGNSTQQQ